MLLSPNYGQIIFSAVALDQCGRNKQTQKYIHVYNLKCLIPLLTGAVGVKIGYLVILSLRKISADGRRWVCVHADIYRRSRPEKSQEKLRKKIKLL